MKFWGIALEPVGIWNSAICIPLTMLFINPPLKLAYYHFAHYCRTFLFSERSIMSGSKKLCITLATAVSNCLEFSTYGNRMFRLSYPNHIRTFSFIFRVHIGVKMVAQGAVRFADLASVNQEGGSAAALCWCGKVGR